MRNPVAEGEEVAPVAIPPGHTGKPKSGGRRARPVSQAIVDQSAKRTRRGTTPIGTLDMYFGAGRKQQADEQAMETTGSNERKRASAGEIHREQNKIHTAASQGRRRSSRRC